MVYLMFYTSDGDIYIYILFIYMHTYVYIMAIAMYLVIYACAYEVFISKSIICEHIHRFIFRWILTYHSKQTYLSYISDANIIWYTF